MKQEHWILINRTLQFSWVFLKCFLNSLFIDVYSWKVVTYKSILRSWPKKTNFMKYQIMGWQLIALNCSYDFFSNNLQENRVNVSTALKSMLVVFLFTLQCSLKSQQYDCHSLIIITKGIALFLSVYGTKSPGEILMVKYGNF